MIKKIFRLKETEVKKVLKSRKPFFSYGFVANSRQNNLGFNRFAIILSSKNTKTSINRNFFRRKFYALAEDSISKGDIDIVFVPKKGKIFDKNSNESIVEFENDIKFILKKIFNGKQ
ncbi:MAG: ribonuclease P protein component [Candidatus Gracilibacteria bacterium]|nr:ribonuclease P protein component [Candidatus Gracilibacteria bacterium]